MTRDRLVRHSCGQMVLRIDDGYMIVLLQPKPIPETDPPEGYERWREGWHHVASRLGHRHRGYPIHQPHKCPAMLPQPEGTLMPDDPFDDPAPATQLDLSSMLGHLLLFEVSGQEIDMDTTNGKSSPIRADVHVLDGPDKGEVVDNALVFPKVLISQLKPRIGGMVLGRLNQGVAKPGKNPPWTLDAPTDDDRIVGRKYLVALLDSRASEVPF